MENKILQVIAVLSILTVMAEISNAWNPPAEAVINNPNPSWKHVDYNECFNGSDSKGWGDIYLWKWSFGDGGSTGIKYGQPPDCDPTNPGRVLHKYSSVGTYQPRLWIMDSHYQTDDALYTLYVVDIDLTADSSYICDELVPIHLSVDTPRGTDKVELSVGPEQNEQYQSSIRIWQYSNKTGLIIPNDGQYSRWWYTSDFSTPKTWYVEGIPGCEAYPNITFEYIGMDGDAPVTIDYAPQVSFTVCEASCDFYVYESLVNEIPYGFLCLTWGSIPSSCPSLLPCDGEDSYELDDCFNELEVSCCLPDGSGGFPGCAYRVFYNNSLKSSCVFAIEPENEVYRRIATIECTDLQVITKIKHKNQCRSKYLGSCWGYYCTKFYTYDCITGAESTIWRRDPDQPPETETDGTGDCPGH